MHCKVSTLVRLPPPLRGRVGERGKPRALMDEMRRYYLNKLHETTSAASVVFAAHRTTEQGADARDDVVPTNLN